jgi:hypothetical protein
MEMTGTINVRKLVSLLIVFLLVSGVSIPAVCASMGPGNDGVANHRVGEVVHFDSPEIIIKENSDVLKIFQVGHVRITIESNPENTIATATVVDLNTGSQDSLDFIVSEESGVFSTQIYHDGVLVRVLTTVNNPLKPAPEEKATSPDSEGPENAYTWDGVTYVNGKGVKYPHPDYDAYGIEKWDDVYVQGTKLKHTHFSTSKSAVVKDLGPIAAGLAYGLLIGGDVGAVAGALIGLLGSNFVGNDLLDENDCNWLLESNDWQLKKFWMPPFTDVFVFTPKYFRTGAYTLWDDIKMGNP